MELKPGIYENMSWADYCRIPYPSPSRMKHGIKSMKRLHRAMQGELEPSEKTVAIGNGVHGVITGEFEERCAVMPPFETHSENLTKGTERKPPKRMYRKDNSLSADGERWQALCREHGKPENYDGSIFVNREPTDSKNTEYYRSSVEAFGKDNEGKTILTQDQMISVNRCVKSVRENVKAARLLENAKLEVVVIADIEARRGDHSAGMVRTKTRLDGMVNPAHVLELKTTHDATNKLFYTLAKRLGYLFSSAWHHVAVESASGIFLQQYDFLVVEDDGDYDCGVLGINEENSTVLDSWINSVHGVLFDYKLALDTGVWGGMYPAGGELLYVPDYDMAENLVEFHSEGAPQ